MQKRIRYTMIKRKQFISSQNLWLSLAVLGATFLGGCKGGNSADTTPATTAVAPKAPPLKLDVDAGVPLDGTTDPNQIKNLLAIQDVHPRTDPFALSPKEAMFDRDQAAQRLASEEGMFQTYFEPPAPPDDTPPIIEPQPYRRVSGILVGDAVLAIIDMGDGRDAHIVRPGEFVPNSEWQVVSIDEENVVLRRKGNVKPNEITVRLEQRPPSAGGAGGPGGGPAGGPGGAGPGPMKGGAGPSGAGGL